jgi:GTP cyclohydrolase II
MNGIGVYLDKNGGDMDKIEEVLLYFLNKKGMESFL